MTIKELLQPKKKPEGEAQQKAADRPLRYYEKDGALKANANKAWAVAFISLVTAFVSLCVTASVRSQPPTVIALKNGESFTLGRTTPDGKPTAAVAGTDDFYNQVYLRRFLSSYQNYTPSNVSDRWAASTNMMTPQLQTVTMKAMQDGDLRGKIDTDQITSVFHLKHIERTTDDPLSYRVYGVKDVYRHKNDSEVTDHLVNEYRIRLATFQRSDANPDGLKIASYSELPIDGERRNEYLAEPDRNLGE